MNLDVNEGGVFLDREFSSLNKVHHVRFFDLRLHPDLHPELDVKNQTFHRKEHVINYVFSEYGKTLHPFYVENKVESRKTFEGVPFLDSKNLDEKIPPVDLHPDFKVIN